MNLLAIDIGGTSVRAARVDDDLIVERVEAPTTSELTETVPSLAHQLARGRQIAAIGVGVPEYVDAGVVTSGEVIAWSERIVAYLSVIAPVRIESDVRCGAVAEWSAEPGSSLLYVSWGTGISSTLVLPDGRAWEGHRGRAIALGERRVGEAPLEALASGRGVERRYEAETGAVVATRELAQRRDDPIASLLLTDAGELLAAAAIDLARTLDPARVVVGGGLGSADTTAWRALQAAWNRASLGIPLRRAHHGADAGLIGAALTARTAR
ncbi:ROK family protein [Microbacterium sp. TNHR37B]|uniref:ROK family protein n=1 Tax=Microbacterium sp. TNHR37B TaxID=1775956 RepID=UPI0007B1EF11|nr:ROK family protein [Microbacterium sp. TNHR37B]KZE89653.1 N-acetylmannosamine kinase [Microbacterium sp. TNHR37B]